MMKSRAILFALALSGWLNASEEGTAQGYAQYKDKACELSLSKALSQVQQEAITLQCQCYRQDSRDWICYTYYKSDKKD